MTLSSEVAARARCADPRFLPIIDEAFKRPGGPAQRRMEQSVCPQCPISAECLKDALDHGEHGPWGGTNRKRRSAVAPHSTTFNLRGVHSDDPIGCGVNAILLRDLGITAAAVKAWAGLTYRGTPPLDVIEAYAAAHDPITV